MTTKKKLDALLSKKFWDDMEERIRGTIDNDHHLFHYTGLSGFYGIINSNSIQVSKSNFLNDSGELVYINDIIDASIDQLLESIKTTHEEETVGLTQLFIEELKNTHKRFIDEINLDDFEVYVLSLTENEDSLTLWYNYSSGDGYNLGFDTKELLDRVTDFSDDKNNEFYVAFGKVVYKKEDQERILHDTLFNSYNYIYQIKDDYKWDEFQKELPRLFFSIITSCSIFFKQSSFSHEEEFRIAFTRKTKETLVDFRESNGVLIPYITVPFVEKLPIKKVTIGPKNNISIAKNGVEYFLRSKGYDLENISVNKSVVTLRY